MQRSFFEKAKAQADTFDQLARLGPLMEKLYWHHRSQARGSPPVSADYHKQLVKDLAEFTGLGFNTKGGGR